MSDHRRESLNAFPDNPAEIADGHILGRDPRESCAQESLAVSEDICLDVRGVSLFYGDKQALNDVSLAIPRNRAYGLRLQRGMARSEIDDRVERGLRSAALWEEVSDRLKDSALELSGGQQQRLVIARAIAVEPEVLLLDEPASALDPISTLKIEQLIDQLKNYYTIVIVTHNMQQAARVSDYTALLYLGELIEHDDTDTIFTNPSRQQTEDYITGRYG